MGNWYVPFDRLGQKQLEVLNGITNELRQTHWVRGFAGTGKTLVMTHLMERVAVLEPQASLCFITYTNALAGLVKSGLHGPVARRVEVMTHTEYLSRHRRYNYVFLDEVQDISSGDLARIRSLADHLYVAGDADQRIYQEGAREVEITSELQPTTWTLLEVFRLTRLLQRVAQSILPRTRLIEGLHTGRNAEATIRLVKHADPSSEAAWVWMEAERRTRPDAPSVILFTTHKSIAHFAKSLATRLNLGEVPRAEQRDYGPFNNFWETAGINLMYFGNRHGEIERGATRSYVYLMTFHSSKGLDFRNVFIPGMNANAFIVHREALASDPDLDRRLLFVAVTRSRENLFISYSSDQPLELLSEIPPEVVTNVIPEYQLGGNDEEDFF